MGKKEKEILGVLGLAIIGTIVILVAFLVFPSTGISRDELLVVLVSAVAIQSILFVYSIITLAKGRSL